MRERVPAVLASGVFAGTAITVAVSSPVLPFVAVFVLAFLVILVYGRWRPGTAVCALCAGEAVVVAAGNISPGYGALLQVILLPAICLVVRPIRGWRDSLYVLVPVLLLAPLFLAAGMFRHVWMQVPLIAGLFLLLVIALAVYRRRVSLVMGGEFL